ncbi:MAG TPA: hypothetical protein VD837_06220 [Terriglobales bacterium]|nr:hypothetical protein [Terriglobales bacterium]
MTRWIAFDEESTAAVAAQTSHAVLFQRGDALTAALATRKRSMVILPERSSGSVLLLDVRFNTPASSTAEPLGYEATGFLGLIDEPVFAHQEPQQPRKRWWQRLLG